MKFKDNMRKFWNFLNEDTWQSWLISLILIVAFIKLLLFPGLTLVTGTELPFVIVESCSMYHSGNLDDYWNKMGAWYEERGVTKEEFASYPLHNGFTKGDIIMVLGRTEIEKGDVIIFNGGSTYPLIHRVVTNTGIGTKGDNNPDQLKWGNNIASLDETNIQSTQVLGEAKVKIVPGLGWIKLIWFEFLKAPQDRVWSCR